MQKSILKEKFKKEIVLITGAGEVGTTLFRVVKPYHGVYLIDKEKPEIRNVKYLHICFPYSRNFVKFVKGYINFYKPGLTIVHSTIAPGTVKKIGGKVVHSPIRGVHPNLYEGIKTFVKYIGADNKKAGQLAKKHLKSLGIKTEIFMPSATTEALKLWDTTQYAWMIVLNKEIKKWCEEYGLDFESIYKKANKSYNEGYQKLGRPEVVRPYLKYMQGPIGGHCIIPNCRLLNSEIAKFILKKNRSYEHGK